MAADSTRPENAKLSTPLSAMIWNVAEDCFECQQLRVCVLPSLAAGHGIRLRDSSHQPYVSAVPTPQDEGFTLMDSILIAPIIRIEN